MNSPKGKLRVIPTKRNKLLEPILGDRSVIGYNEEIHQDDSIELNYKLPLGAIKRLIKSYYSEIRSIDEQSVYLAITGSTEIRLHPYCYRMLANIQQQLDKHGCKGKKIIDEVFNQYFKDDYEKLKRYEKNHSGQGVDFFEICDDPLCCNYSNNIFFKAKTFLGIVKKAFLCCLMGPIPKDGDVI